MFTFECNVVIFLSIRDYTDQETKPKRRGDAAELRAGIERRRCNSSSVIALPLTRRPLLAVRMFYLTLVRDINRTLQLNLMFPFVAYVLTAEYLLLFIGLFWQLLCRHFSTSTASIKTVRHPLSTRKNGSIYLDELINMGIDLCRRLASPQTENWQLRRGPRKQTG